MASNVVTPFVHIGGRRYLRDRSSPYPLPVDLPELHRQSLRTLTMMRVFGAPFCAPQLEESPPMKVLELACGSALWSSACHDYFARRGHTNISFTGIDIVPLAGDLRQVGIDFRFVQCDWRKPLPFPDGEFDFIFAKDLALCAHESDLQESTLEEPLRLLKHGGVVEIWESDHLTRILLPNPPVPPGTCEEDSEQAEETGTYLISPSTGFSQAQNRFLADFNTWLESAFDRLKLSIAPCALANWAFTTNPESWNYTGSRRVAIPFGTTRWESEGLADSRGKGRSRASTNSSETKPSSFNSKNLSEEQASLRQTALLITIQFIEALEPVLKAESGKRQDEWDRWWATMIQDLIEKNGTYNGECLEIGAWWGEKA
jgi:SAM-dependent methyltransferase